MDLYLMNTAICFPNTYPLDSDLSGPSRSKGDSAIHQGPVVQKVDSE